MRTTIAVQQRSVENSIAIIETARNIYIAVSDAIQRKQISQGEGDSVRNTFRAFRINYMAINYMLKPN